MSNLGHHIDNTKEDTIRVKLRYLCTRGFITMGPHPVQCSRWDQTIWYRFYPDVVQKALDTLKPPDNPLRV